jgi:restriction system protein
MSSPDQSDPSDKSDSSDQPDDLQRLLPKHGGYRKLRSFQTAQLAYDATVIFCERFVEKRSRTRDQMVQAARSGVQNIAEGSVASGTSKKTELKLTNVARASLEELLLDYEDFLRQHCLRLWPKDCSEALAIRRSFQTETNYEAQMRAFRTASPETFANSLLCLINQASYLLGRQIETLDRQFLENGGFTERLYNTRRAVRSEKSDSSDRSDKSDQSDAPKCPRCSKPMVLRTARKGPHAGQRFWGCSTYPECNGTAAAPV